MLFRSEDLFYEISQVSLTVPPVRERKGDGIALAQAFLEKWAKKHRRRLCGFSQDALGAIQSYQWPGNVRELENKVQGAVILAEGRYVTRADLGLNGAGVMPVLNLREARQQAEARTLTAVVDLEWETRGIAGEYRLAFAPSQIDPGEIAHRVQHGDQRGTDEQETENVTEGVVVVDRAEQHDRQQIGRAHV